MTKRTHYAPHEYFALIRERHPTISAVTVFALHEANKIYPTKAGCDILYSAAQLSQIPGIISKTKLVTRNGFLVLSE